jgi:hypothetical protein
MESKNKQETEGILKGEFIAKFAKYLRIRWYGHVGRTQNQTMTTKIATATMLGTRKRGKSRKI